MPRRKFLAAALVILTANTFLAYVLCEHGDVLIVTALGFLGVEDFETAHSSAMIAGGIVYLAYVALYCLPYAVVLYRRARCVFSGFLPPFFLSVIAFGISFGFLEGFSVSSYALEAAFLLAFAPWPDKFPVRLAEGELAAHPAIHPPA